MGVFLGRKDDCVDIAELTPFGYSEVQGAG